MKKRVGLLIAACAIGSAFGAAKDTVRNIGYEADDVVQAVTSGAVYVAKPNVYKDRITLEESTKWNSVFPKVEAFVKKYGKYDSTAFEKIYSTIVNANNNALNGIKTIVGTNRAPATVKNAQDSWKKSTKELKDAQSKLDKFAKTKIANGIFTINKKTPDQLLIENAEKDATTRVLTTALIAVQSILGMAENHLKK